MRRARSFPRCRRSTLRGRWLADGVYSLPVPVLEAVKRLTVGATVFGLVPLAHHGGPLWEGLCYAQIGGLILANYVTKLLVPALYAIAVLDLKLIKWEVEPQVTSTEGATQVATV